MYLRVLALFLMANGLFVSERGRAAPEPAPEADAGDPFGTADALLWVLVAGRAAAYGLDLWDEWPIGRSLVGPNYDPESIDARIFWTRFTVRPSVCPTGKKPFLPPPWLWPLSALWVC